MKPTIILVTIVSFVPLRGMQDAQSAGPRTYANLVRPHDLNQEIGWYLMQYQLLLLDIR